MPERSGVTGMRKKCLFCFPTLICHQSLIIIAAILLICTQTFGASRHYYMDNKLDCNMQGFIDISSRESMTVSLKSDPQKEFNGRCVLKFRARNNREYIKVEFKSFVIGRCSVMLSTNDNSYSCGQVPPSKILLDRQQITLSLEKDAGDHEYNGDIIVTTYTKDYSVPNQDEVSNPTLIGIIIGVVCGIIVIILVIAIAGHCYYKSVKKRQTRNYGNGCMDGNEQSSIGYINEGVKNGSIIKNNNSPKNNDRSLLSHDVEVKQFYDCVEENKKHTIPNINNLANNSKKSSDIDNNSDKTRQQNSNPTPKSPVLSALHNSPKFQASFKSTDAEAEERSNRFSQGSTLPPTPPPLPTVPTSPHMQCSQTNSNHAGIRRVPKISASSEDMEHLEREMNGIELENRGNNPIPPSNPPLSSTKNVPVTTNFQPQSSVELPTLVQTSSKDNSNQHTLRPSRVQDKKKQGDITDGQPMPSRPQKTHKEKDISINSLRKHGHKIPKSSKGKQLLSDGESNFTSGDDQGHRSDTPLSELSSRMTRTDDNESLPPLQRTTSRQSLFASRTSLYARRGKRERRSSISDSVTTYAHDDIDMYIASEQDPMDRRDARAFKSLVDITKTSKDGSYQDQNKKLTSKKNAYKKSTSARKSSSSTQTIEQKGTQTEPSQKKVSQSKESDSNSALSWGTSTSKGDIVNPMQPNEMSKSQFQPISKANDMESSSIGNQYLNNDPTSTENAELIKPTKSPWELLCELTDAEMKMKDSSLPSGNALYSSDFPSNVDGQSRPSVDNIPSVYHPSISSQVSDKESYTPAYSPATVPSNYPPSATSNLTNKLYPRKSSWEALKELTDAQLSYPLHGTSESIV